MNSGQIIPGNATEVIFVILGIIVGLVYGFDGWRGSVKDLRLSESPRWKNFLLVLTGGFSTFIVEYATPSVDKQRLLVFFLLGFVVLAAIVVFGWGFFIWAKFLILRLRDSDNYPPPPFSPVSDYL